MPDDRTIVLKPIKWYKNLATRKGRLEAEAFLIEGGRRLSSLSRIHTAQLIEYPLEKTELKVEQSDVLLYSGPMAA